MKLAAHIWRTWYTGEGYNVVEFDYSELQFEVRVSEYRHIRYSRKIFATDAVIIYVIPLNICDKRCNKETINSMTTVFLMITFNYKIKTEKKEIFLRFIISDNIIIH